MSSRPSRALLALLAAALCLSLGGALTARSAPAPFRSASGLTLQQGQTLPIFRLSAPPVSAEGTLSLAGRFSAVHAGQAAGAESYLGSPRYTVPNTATLSLLTQYGASGGFYATDLGQSAAEEPRGELDLAQAERLTCRFLLDNAFIDGEGNLLRDQQTPQGVRTPNNQTCDFNSDPQNPLYPARLIQAASVPADAPDALPAVQEIGLLVQVPMNIPFNRSGLPIGGAGGHISLLFRTTNVDDQGPSLDDSVPGLAALAMPFFGRSPERLREVPIRDPNAIRAEVEQAVLASFPGADSVTLPEPDAFYDVKDAAVVQTAIEPVLSFSGITVVVDGQTIILRDIVVPLAEGGAGGFGPDVSITAPTSGGTFVPGAPVSFSGEISGGVGPYTYQWLTAGGDPLGEEATLAEDGPVGLVTADLPVPGRPGEPGPLTVVLRVTDAEGAVREASVTIAPTVAPSLYLPALFNGGAAEARAARPAALAPAEPAQAGGYSFGVEANWDYPPSGAGGSDLPGVVPDANGFRAGMLGYGYSQRFAWYNSLAWERDWRDCGLGGGDCSYGVDRADYVYYSGHGSAGGISLASSVDSSWVGGANARFQSLRWVGFSSCQTLRVQGYTAPNEPIRDWFNAFQGAHMLMGFNSNMRDIAFGGRLVDNMRMPSFFGIDFPWAQQTIAQAWVNTAFQLNAGKPAYLYARGTNGANPLGDKLPRPGQPMPPRPLAVASYHWVWWNE